MAEEIVTAAAAAVTVTLVVVITIIIITITHITKVTIKILLIQSVYGKDSCQEPPYYM